MIATGKGRLFLLTGLSGSGKSTLGRLLVEHFNHYGVRQAYLIDGDFSRAFFEGDKAFDAESRAEMTRRMAFGAKTLVENNIDVVLANIAGAKETRLFLRHKFPEMIEIYMKADINALRKHDVKGIYRAGSGSKGNIVGIDIPYEEPDKPDIVVNTYDDSPEAGLSRVLEYLSGRGPIIGTKADTLESLRSYVTEGVVLPHVVTSYSEYKSNPAGIVARIEKNLGTGKLAVRSSCRMEDSKRGSNAGAFESVLDVAAASLEKAISKVRRSYIAKAVSAADTEQILVQPMVESVRSAGVIFSRFQEADSPYMVISYDESGRTDRVTGGEGGENIFLNRFLNNESLGRWQKLVLVLRELEALFPKFPLEVEFAETKDGTIYILQCRPLNVRHGGPSLEQNAAELLEELKLRFERAQAPHVYIQGSMTVLSDMADWNPSEMIGDRPSTLAYSMYRELITDRTWREARASQGYYDVVHANLMISMARKPYIDTRASLASLTPAGISPALRSRVVEGCIKKLIENPYLHDKIEFDVAYTCIDCSTEARMLSDGYLDKADRKAMLKALGELTTSLMKTYHESVKHDMQLLYKLEEIRKGISGEYLGRSNYWEAFQAAYLLLEPLRTMGVLPFARLARLGFIARSVLFSLAEAGVISRAGVDNYLQRIPTVATRLRMDLARAATGAISRKSFCETYGHLRMSTYDITSLRYDQMLDDLLSGEIDIKRGGSVAQRRVALNKVAISRALKCAGLNVSAELLLEFAVTVTQQREYAKFIFSRSLSDVLEYFAKGGEQLGLGRSDLQNATVATLLRFRNPELGSSAKAAQYLRSRIGEKSTERSVYELIRLPSVLISAMDIDIVRTSKSKPNFITSRKVSARAIVLSAGTRPSEVKIKGKIVVIVNADPGYDWVFGAGIAGLVTKYGGVASHMAVRCAEFGIPGVIGCGEEIFEKARTSCKILLDCAAEVVHVA